MAGFTPAMATDSSRTASSNEQAAATAEGPYTQEERLKVLGLPNLKDASPEVIGTTLKGWARDYYVIPSELDRQLFFDGARKLLDGVLTAPVTKLKAALQDHAPPTDEVDTVGDGSRPAGVIDLVQDGSEKRWIVTTLDGPQIVDDVEGAGEWPQVDLPWRLPEKDLVAAHLAKPSPPASLWEKIRAWFKAAVILPNPEDGWADLLTAWVLGSHLHRLFTYFPLLYLPGEPERGKTRLGKAIIYLSFRGHYTPSISPATFFRWREWHGITLLFDVGSITSLLDGGMLDFLLNSFEKGGSVSRVIKPDAPPSEQVQSFRVHGPTILLTNEGLRRAHANVRSRCLEVVMPEAGHVEVPDAVTPEDARDLFARTVAWAAMNEGAVLPEVEVPFRGRLRDLARPILQGGPTSQPWGATTDPRSPSHAGP